MTAARVAAFTIAVLLLSESIESTWGWHLALTFLTLVTIRNLVSFVAFLISSALLVGLLGDNQGTYIALTIFTGVALLVNRALPTFRSPLTIQVRTGE